MSRTQDFPFDIAYVADLLHLRVRRRCADGFYTDCPFCGDNRGKMKITDTINVWRCNYCGESGGMLRLYAKVHNISLSEANREICNSIMNGNTYNESPALVQTAPRRVEQSALAEISVVDKTLNGLLGMLKLSEQHREHLRTVRGLSDEEIDRLGYKSTPPFYMCKALTDRLISLGCSVSGVPGFYQKDGHWTVRFLSVMAGIILPVRGIDGLIHGFQIRLDQPFQDAAKGNGSGAKYIWLSSAGKPMGSSSGSPIHFVGNPNARVVYLTEGVLKADIAHCLMDRTFIGIAGINNTASLELMLSYLAANGTQTVIAAPDIDRYSNGNVHAGLDKICFMIRKYGMECRILDWNPNYKGIDDWQLALKRKTQGNTAQKCSILLNAASSSTEKQQKYRIYQLDFSGGRVFPFAFRDIKYMREAGYEQPPAEDYRLVYDGILPCSGNASISDCLTRIAELYRDDLPEGYRGRYVAPSDIVELYDDNDSKYFYREKNGFCLVQFSPLLDKLLRKEYGRKIRRTKKIRMG